MSSSGERALGSDAIGSSSRSPFSAGRNHLYRDAIRANREARNAAITTQPLCSFTDALVGAARPLVASLGAQARGGIWHVLECPA
jgi:hypothetical protein